jgi:hypothetical protein
MPPREDLCHPNKVIKYKKVVSRHAFFLQDREKLATRADTKAVLLKKPKTHPDIYYIEDKNPCDMCFGAWPCVMNRTARKCRVCDGQPCSLYDPKAVRIEPESSIAKKTARKTDPKTTRPTTSSLPKASSSKRQISELSDLPELPELLLDLPELSDSEPEAESPQPKKRNRPTKSSSSKASSSKRQSTELSELPKFPELPELSDSETEPDPPQPKKKTKPIKSSSSTATSKRQFIDLSVLSDDDSDPIEPQRKRTKSSIELAPARNQEMDDVGGEGIDDGKYWHNCPITRKLIVKLEG